MMRHVKLLSHNDKVILHNLLGRQESAKNSHTPSWLGISLAVYILSASLMYADQLSDAGHTISGANAQLEQPHSSEASPFLEWYETQKDNLQSDNPLAVKILSPAKGERVPVGQELVISGTSTDNATSDCKVSVIVNGIRPYQLTVANGTGGTHDYSTWNFIITPVYTIIKEGPGNKITSKLECTPNLTKWYSVNVTGIDSAMAIPNSVAAPVPGGQTLSTPLSISVNVNSDSLTLEDDQTIEARVLDPISQLQVNNAAIELEITDPLGNSAVVSDYDGDILYTLSEESEGGEENPVMVTPGTYTINLRASAAGYDLESLTTTFSLIDHDDEDEESESDEVTEDEDSESLGELFE